MCDVLPFTGFCYDAVGNPLPKHRLGWGVGWQALIQCWWFDSGRKTRLPSRNWRQRRLKRQRGALVQRRPQRRNGAGPREWKCQRTHSFHGVFLPACGQSVLSRWEALYQELLSVMCLDDTKRSKTYSRFPKGLKMRHAYS